VVWEGWRREAFPYPDHAQLAAIHGRLAERVNSAQSGQSGNGWDCLPSAVSRSIVYVPWFTGRLR
jgi:hypothetical protein